MASALADLRHEWKLFAHDAPGQRFQNHRARMKQKSRTHAAMAFAVGVVLIGAGTVLLFIPGPGTPLIIFGLAPVATHSKRLTHLLDRAEPRLRRTGHSIASRWSRLSRAGKATVVGAGAILASAFLLGTWTWVLADYVL